MQNVRMKMKNIHTIVIFIICFSCNASYASMACDHSLSNIILKNKSLTKLEKEKLEKNKKYYLELEDCYRRATPLGASVIVGNENLLKYLVSLGANINKHTGKHLSKEHNTNTLSPLILSIHNKNNNIFNYLVSLGADQNSDARNMHPIFFAVAYNNVYVVNYYLNKNVNPNISHNGKSLLSIAKKRKRLDIVELLLNNGAK